LADGSVFFNHWEKRRGGLDVALNSAGTADLAGRCGDLLVYRTLVPLPRLVVCGGVVGTGGAALLVRWGLDETTRGEIARRMPTRFRLLQRWIEPRIRAERSASAERQGP